MSLRWNIAQKAELKWWKNYLKGKSPEEYLAWKKSYWQGFMKKIGLAIPKAESLLDAGCGPAGIFTIFENNQVVALDPLMDSYEKEIPHFSPSQYPNCKFVSQSLESFQSAEKFDQVYCINAINHVDDLQLAFQNLANQVKPGGRLVVSIDAHNHSFLKKIFQLIPGDILHPHQYNLEEYKKMMENTGVKITAEYRLDKAFIFDYWVLVGERSM